MPNFVQAQKDFKRTNGKEGQPWYCERCNRNHVRKKGVGSEPLCMCCGVSVQSDMNVKSGVEMDKLIQKIDNDQKKSRNWMLGLGKT